MESLDAVEWVMAVEVEIDAEFPDSSLSCRLTTFADLVQRVAARRARQGHAG